MIYSELIIMVLHLTRCETKVNVYRQMYECAQGSSTIAGQWEAFPDKLDEPHSCGFTHYQGI